MNCHHCNAPAQARREGQWLYLPPGWRVEGRSDVNWWVTCPDCQRARREHYRSGKAEMWSYLAPLTDVVPGPYSQRGEWRTGGTAAGFPILVYCYRLG